MKKYIIPTAKAANIYTPTILAGSDTPGIDPTQQSESDDRSKGNAIWGNDED